MYHTSIKNVTFLTTKIILAEFPKFITRLLSNSKTKTTSNYQQIRFLILQLEYYSSFLKNKKT